jgi:hypothetical protein
VLFSPVNGQKRDDVKLTIGKEPVKVEKTAERECSSNITPRNFLGA